MPMLPNPITVIVIKAIGYTTAAVLLKKFYQSDFNIFLFAGMRVGLGIVASIATFPLLMILAPEQDREILFYVWLAAIRFAVWGYLIWMVLERKNFLLWRLTLVAALCVLWSFALDAVHYSLEKKFPSIMSIPWC